MLQFIQSSAVIVIRGELVTQVRLTSKNKPDGFSIVELLVVVVVIGIIAVISFVVYNGSQERAKIALMKNDLKAASEQLKLEQWDRNGRYPDSIDGLNLPVSEGTQYQYTADNSSSTSAYCLSAVNLSMIGKSYHVTQTGKIEEGVCDGHRGNPDMINLAGANSSFEKAGSSVEVARNHFIYPGGEIFSSSYFEAWAGTGNARSTSANVESDWSKSGTHTEIQFTTVANPNSGDFGVRPRSNTSFVPVGEKWTMSYSLVRLTESGSITEANMAQATGYTKHAASPAKVAQVGEVNKIWLTFTLNQEPPSNIRASVYTNNKSVGSRFAVSDIDFYPGDYQPNREWFDGSHSPGDDFSVAWLGSENASMSVLRGSSVQGVGNMQNGVQVRSSVWSKLGGYSLRMMPRHDTSRDTSSVVVGSTGNLGVFERGKTYTVLVTTWAEGAPRPSGNGGRLQIVSNTVAGWTGASTHVSIFAPNTPGEHDIRATFTVPNDAHWFAIRLHNYGTLNHGDVWWDNLLVVEGEYNGPYFQ